MQNLKARQKTKPTPKRSWFDRLTQKVAAPHPSIKEVGARRQASLISWLALIFLITDAIGTLGVIAIGPQAAFRTTAPYLLIFLLLISLGTYILGRSKYYRMGSILFVSGLTVMTFLYVGLDQVSPVTAGLFSIVPLTFVIGSALLTLPGMALLVAVNTLGVIMLSPFRTDLAMDVLGPNVGAVLTMGILLLIVMAYRNNVERERLAELQAVNVQLKQARAGLELRVAERTRALEASAEVSRRLSTILDQEELVRSVVEEVQQAFGYYHAQIYLFDDRESSLVMVGGTGEAGRVLLNLGHKIPRGRGLVGRAGDTNHVVLAPYTSAEVDWLPNPLLPETKSEVSVPIAVGDRVLGVLDVQHNVANGLGQQDVDFLLAVSSQVAIAVQNAQLFRLTQRQAELETMANLIGRQIQSASTVEDVLKIAARELNKSLGARQTLVQVGSPKLE